MAVLEFILVVVFLATAISIACIVFEFLDLPNKVEEISANIQELIKLVEEIKEKID